MTRSSTGRRIIVLLAVAIVAISFPMVAAAEPAVPPIGPEICQSPGSELLFRFDYRMDYDGQQWIGDLVVRAPGQTAVVSVTLQIFPDGQSGFQLNGMLDPDATLTFNFGSFWTPDDSFDIFVTAPADLCFKPVYREYIEPALRFSPPGNGAAADKSQACIKVKTPAKHPLCK